MKDYQQRVIDEKTELDERHDKLSIFMEDDKFSALPCREQDLLDKQWIAMRSYSRALKARIIAFTN